MSMARKPYVNQNYNLMHCQPCADSVNFQFFFFSLKLLMVGLLTATSIESKRVLENLNLFTKPIMDIVKEKIFLLFPCFIIQSYLFANYPMCKANLFPEAMCSFPFGS